ncbi:hypothetical protein AKJ16_DCAP05367 [Drosera capensis]
MGGLVCLSRYPRASKLSKRDEIRNTSFDDSSSANLVTIIAGRMFPIAFSLRIPFSSSPSMILHFTPLIGLSPSSPSRSLIPRDFLKQDQERLIQGCRITFVVEDVEHCMDHLFPHDLPMGLVEARI